MYNVAKHWIEKHGYEFVEDTRLFKKLTVLIQEMKTEMSAEAVNLKSYAEKLVSHKELLLHLLPLHLLLLFHRLNGSLQIAEVKQMGYDIASMPGTSSYYLLEKKLSSKSKSPANLPGNFDQIPEEEYLRQIDQLEIAKQLTVTEYTLYHSVQPKECLSMFLSLTVDTF